MVDDSDFPRTARRIENTGRVYSHLIHKTIPGFKSLFLGITDGMSRFVLDFAILGEKGGKKGITRYGFEGKELTARALINLLEARGEARRSRKLGCQYITADVRFAGTDVRLYFVKRKKESWNGIMTTNLSPGVPGNLSDLCHALVPRGLLQGNQGVAGYGQVPIPELRCAACRNHDHGLAIQSAFPGQKVHQL